MDKNLRKVSFRLNYQDGFDPDLPQPKERERDEESKLRKGYFHDWVKRPATDPETQAGFIETLALVEEADTHIMHEVKTDLINFQDEPV